MTLGALAVTGNLRARAAAGVELHDATIMPFDGYLGAGVDTLDVLERSWRTITAGSTSPPRSSSRPSRARAA